MFFYLIKWLSQFYVQFAFLNTQNHMNMKPFNTGVNLDYTKIHNVEAQNWVQNPIL